MVHSRPSCILPAVIALVVFWASTTLVKAQESTPAARPKISVEQVFRQWDRNSDGKLTPDEVPREQLFKMLDRNGDGVVTREEASQFLGGATGPKPGRQAGQPQATGSGQKQGWRGVGVSQGAPLPPAENFKPRPHGAEAKGKGSYSGLTLLGVCDRTTPALAGEVAQLAAALSSFEDAQARLRQMGVNMPIRRIANVAYHFAQRARSRRQLEGMGIEGSLARKRVVISTDGGRLRVRKSKRGNRGC